MPPAHAIPPGHQARLTHHPNNLNALGAASLGIEMGAAVAVGYFVGHWLDGQLGTAPYGMLFVLLCGVGAGFRSLWRVVANTRRLADQTRIEGCR